MKKWQWVSQVGYQEYLSAHLWRLVFLSNAFILLLLAFFLPWQIKGLIVFELIIKYLGLKCQKQIILFGGLLGLVGLGCLALFSIFPQEGVTYTAVSFLALASVGKLVETRNSRDMRILFLLSLCLCMSVLMYSQAILVFILVIFAFFMQIYTLAAVNQRHAKYFQFMNYWDVAKLAIYALPFVVICFMFFPRFQPLWGGWRFDNQSVTGLPDEMNLGDLSQLIQSDEVAFRVQFHGKRPENKFLYWRGPVLWQYTGTAWRQRKEDWRSSLEEMTYDQTSIINYDLTMAGETNQWLTLLDLPISVSPQAKKLSAHQVKITNQRNVAKRWQIQSALNYHLQQQQLSASDQRQALQLPDKVNLSRTRELSQQLYNHGGRSVDGFAQQFFHYLQRQHFTYTLQPPSGAGDVEQFLFVQRSGFCEHFANAMAVAARTVGIPSRVIIGYQGGSYNNLSDEWVVRQEDAHGWVELWDKEKGWVRYDPTGAVASWRLASDSINNQYSQTADTRTLASRLSQQWAAIAWLRNALDATQSFWQNWVVDFNQDKQQSFMSQLTFRGSLFIKFIAALALLLSLLFLLPRYRKYKRQQKLLDEVDLKITKLIKRLDKMGWQRDNKESFARFIQRVGSDLSDSEMEIFEKTAQYYIDYRFKQIESRKQDLLLGLSEINQTLRIIK